MQPPDTADAGDRVHPTRAGDLVTIRSHRWRVLNVHTYDGCRLLTVVGLGADNAGIQRRFLSPFETIGACNRPTSIRFVPPQRWRHACRALLAADTPPGGLRVAHHARIDLLPHQLEPAMAVMRGLGSRVLLADEVGLGKTIQAGLIITELRARDLAPRVLVLTPAGLRDQWASELADRFGIGASIVDVHDMHRRVASLPIGLNPWSTVSVAIASIDYVKRPEILHSVLSCRWDILAVDEAHGTAGISDRHAAVAALASRSAYVLLLTATPHSGDARAFNSLCRTGARDEALLVFRRTRADVRRHARRRVHRLQVRESSAELDMHTLLSGFTRAVRLDHQPEDVWLPLSVLHKRALSSARSLGQSIKRRLETLAPLRSTSLASPVSFDAPHQLPLPLADPSGDFEAADETPGWAAELTLRDRDLEWRMLTTLDQAANKAAVAGETKFSAIRRLLARIAEPLIIFTEYRDTLLHLREALDQPAVILHGGLTREERRAALDEFVEGRHRILLATDAAGEGLNLQRRCRIVINLELPWNPVRLEQRIGRVDRIGQERVVHVFHLVARDTFEAGILDRLKARIARARQDIGVADPIASDEESAKAVLWPGGNHDETAADNEEPPVDEPASGRALVNLGPEAGAEARRLMAARDLSGEREEAVRASLEGGGAWAVRTRLRRTRVLLGARMIALFRVEDEDGHGRTADSTLVPVAIALSITHRPIKRTDVRAILRACGTDFAAHAEAGAARRRAEFREFSRALVETRLAREQRIADAIDSAPPTPSQSGLFDRRADDQRLAARAAFAQSADEAAERLDRCRRAGVAVARPARLLLVIAP